MSFEALNLAAGDPLGHNYDYSILSYNGWAVMTNHILMMMLVTLFMLVWLPKVGRSVATGKTGSSHDYVTKGRWSHMIEVICVYIRDEVARPVMGKHTDKFMPFIWTVFFFILFNNLIGMFPMMDITALGYKALSGGGADHAMVEAHGTLGGALDDGHITTPDDVHSEGHALEGEAVDEHAAVEHDELEDLGEHAIAAVTGEEHAKPHGHGDNPAAGWIWFHDLTNPGHSHFHGIGGTATGNIAVTFALSLIAILVVIGAAIKMLGLGGFLHHLTLDAPVAIWPLTVTLEIIGLIAKPFALMVRLFANMTAGHVMLAALIGFTSMAWNGFVTYMTEGGEVAISTGGFIGFIPLAIGSILFATAIGMLEVLVAFIQAFVFTFLTTMFISMFLPHEHHDHEHGHEGHGSEAHGHGHGHAGAVPA